MTIAVDSEARGNKMYNMEVRYMKGINEDYVIDSDIDIDSFEDTLLEAKSAVTIRTKKGFVYLNLIEVASIQLTKIRKNNEQPMEQCKQRYFESNYFIS